MDGGRRLRLARRGYARRPDLSCSAAPAFSRSPLLRGTRFCRSGFFGARLRPSLFPHLFGVRPPVFLHLPRQARGGFSAASRPFGPSPVAVRSAFTQAVSRALLAFSSVQHIKTEMLFGCRLSLFLRSASLLVPFATAGHPAPVDWLVVRRVFRLVFDYGAFLQFSGTPMWLICCSGPAATAGASESYCPAALYYSSGQPPCSQPDGSLPPGPRLAYHSRPAEGSRSEPLRPRLRVCAPQYVPQPSVRLSLSAAVAGPPCALHPLLTSACHRALVPPAPPGAVS